MRYLRPSEISDTALRRVLLGELEARAIVTNEKDLEVVRELRIPIDLVRSIKEGQADAIEVLLSKLDPNEVVDAAKVALGRDFYLLPTRISELIYEKLGRERARELVMMHHTPSDLITKLVEEDPELRSYAITNPLAPDRLLDGLPPQEWEQAVYRRVLYPENSYRWMCYLYLKNVTPLTRIAFLGRGSYDVTDYLSHPPYKHMLKRILRVLRGVRTVKVRAPWQFHVLQRLDKGMRTTKELRANQWTAINVQWCYFYGWIVKDGKRWKLTDVGREALEIVRKKKELMPPTIELPVAPTKEGVACMLTRRW